MCASIVPPTIDFLQREGVAGLRVACRTGYCAHSAALRFDATGLPPDLPFPAIEASGRLVCLACGGRRVSTILAWPVHANGGQPAVGWILPLEVPRSCVRRRGV